MAVIGTATQTGAARALSTERTADWRDRAACREEDPELFFPSASGPSAVVMQQVAEAQRICRGCPVQAQCGRYAAESGQQAGVWAGVWRDGHARDLRTVRIAQNKQRAKDTRAAGLALALDRGAEVILARMRGADEYAIAARTGVSPAAVRRALAILLPPADDPRLDPTALERVLREGARLSALIAQRKTDKEVAREMRTSTDIVKQARRIRAHRGAAVREYKATTGSAAV